MLTKWGCQYSPYRNGPQPQPRSYKRHRIARGQVVGSQPFAMLENNHLDMLGQQPFLHKLYTQLCCIFPVTDASTHDTIVKTLRDGLDRLSASFPWLAGNVINEGACEGNTGVYRIVPSGKIPLSTRDLRGDASAPSMDGLRSAQYPMSMLDEKLIAPCVTLNLPGNTIGLAADSAPVFAVQANFIEGGLMLTFVGQHNAMDMTGQGHIINLLSQACHERPFTPDEIMIGNPDRTKTISLLDDSYEPGPELDPQMVKPQIESSNGNPAPPPESSWAYVTFSAASLASLKSLATKTMAPSVRFVSTDDTVSAFIWQCISRARIPRLQPNSLSTFARAVDVRQRMGIPATYPGMLQNMTYNSDTLQHLADEPLGAIASELRAQLDPKTTDLAYNTRAMATFIARSADKTKLSVTACVDTSSGILLSSWAKIDTYDLDFNLGLGKPEAVRRPSFVPFESLIYLMPRSPNGEMTVAICLRDEDWKRLKVDEEFTKYARYAG